MPMAGSTAHTGAMTRDTTIREPVSLAVARALDERLHLTLEDHFALGESRLYGCCLMTGGMVDGRTPGPETFRYSFLGSAPSVYDLLDGSFAVLARAFDAACVVTTGWGAPVAECSACRCDTCDGDVCDCVRAADDVVAMRPSDHPLRFRLVICTAISDDGVCSVVRDSRRPDQPVAMCERGEGLLPDALETMWFGDVVD